MDPVTGSVLALLFCTGIGGVAARTKKPTKEDEDYESLLRVAHAQGRDLELERELRAEER